MAVDAAQYALAFDRRQELIEENRFSVLPHAGYLAIICSFAGGFYDNHRVDGYTDESKQDLFCEEAQYAASLYSSIGHMTRILLDTTVSDMQEVLQDTEAHSIITIGHGSFSGLAVRKDDNSFSYDWHKLSDDATHLKRGWFISGQCGHFARDLNVPLSLFIMEDISRIQGVVGSYFDPENINDTKEYAKIRQIFAEGTQFPDYKTIKRTFRKPVHATKSKKRN